ncbi:hypothetical protein ID875_29145 [Streptomyces globisporus]|uniref:Condensation domain-containing protein n=1 Tax=Streptomyces globisporus TaxID=1908 RepID=A0A927BPV3_STRGL|nr:hypothetical protein [Streptomyces globisporus]
MRTRIALRTEQVAPLSPAQYSLWFLDQLTGPPASTSSRTRTGCVAPWTPLRWENALNALVERHEPLRTRVDQVAGEPRQAVRRHHPRPLRRLDLSQDPARAEREAAAFALRPSTWRVRIPCARCSSGWARGTTCWSARCTTSAATGCPSRSSARTSPRCTGRRRTGRMSDRRCRRCRCITATPSRPGAAGRLPRRAAGAGALARTTGGCRAAAAAHRPCPARGPYGARRPRRGRRPRRRHLGGSRGRGRHRVTLYMVMLAVFAMLLHRRGGGRDSASVLPCLAGPPPRKRR